MSRPVNLVLGALSALALCVGQAQAGNRTLIPHPAWDCGMPGGIPSPEGGRFAFEIRIPLARAADIGTTPYGNRRVAVGNGGAVTGKKLMASVMRGSLDYELTLANGTIEIEQLLVLRTADGGYIYARNAGVGPGAKDIRVVMDFEAPNASRYAWLNSGHYVARRKLDASAMTLTLRVYDISDIAVTAANAIRIAKPDGVPAQPWNPRTKGATEQPGTMLIRENVTLGPPESVGASKRVIRNIIPITGGKLSGRINGHVLMAGADYQTLSRPATLDARYLWQAADGEIIIVRNAGPFGALVPTFEARVDGPYAFLNNGLFLSSNPGMGQGGVGLSFYASTH